MAKRKQSTQTKDAAEIVRKSVEELIPYARNARTHDDAQVAGIAGSIKEFGFTNPVLIDGEGGIIAGHGRVLAARKLKMLDVPCIILSHLTPEQKRAYILADNKLALNAGWDGAMLKAELDAIMADGFDIGDIGFNQEEFDALCKEQEPPPQPCGDAEPQIDKAAELAEKWGVKRGQLWKLGNHRILCGDSTNKEDVEKVMQGEKAELCFTSPPYGQLRDYRDEATALVQDWDGLMNGVFGNLPMSEAGQVLVNLGMIHIDGEWSPYWDKWIEWMRSQGWKRFGLYVWDRGSGMPGDWNGRCAPSFELIFHFNKKAFRPAHFVEKLEASINLKKVKFRNKDGSFHVANSTQTQLQTHKIPDSCWRIARAHTTGKVESAHPAVFPVELPTFAMQSWPGTSGIAFEPFSGSGTTIIACEQLGRKCRAIEISPAYVAVAIQRWADATGGEPVILQTH